MSYNRQPFASINALSRKGGNSWFGNFLTSLKRYPSLPNVIHNNADQLVPKELIGIGCNSAVWSAQLSAELEESGAIINSEVAVKVLYNYYASSQQSFDQNSICEPPEFPLSIEPAIDQSVDWPILQKQLTRECDLRPSSGHPNIVPLIGYFLDRAPSSRSNPRNKPSTGTDSSITVIQPTNNSLHGSSTSPNSVDWVGANTFPEGFAGRPQTYYLLMPKFDATLEDLLLGNWHPLKSSEPRSEQSPILTTNVSNISSFSNESYKSLSVLDIGSTQQKEQSIELNSNHQQTLSISEAVVILAQLFDAVAELERFGVAHRDIKPNNILLRRRNLPFVDSKAVNLSDGLNWLDDSEVKTANTLFHVAITDFGCAIRTRDSVSIELQATFNRFFGKLLSDVDQRSDCETLAHSGNTLLLAPEIASQLLSVSDHLPVISAKDYSRADSWTVATLAYPLFGIDNPFTNGTLNSGTYTIEDLPPLPNNVPGVIVWLVSNCLQRSLTLRPEADLVADVLHTWCLVRHINRRAQKQTRFPHSNVGLVEERESEHTFPVNSLTQLLEEINEMDQSKINVQLVDRIEELLNVCWAVDWLTGPARPPDGLRVSFYRRVTPGRFAWCLHLVYRQESIQATRRAELISSLFGAGKS